MPAPQASSRHSYLPPSSYGLNPRQLDTIPSESSSNFVPGTPKAAERTRKTSAKRKASEIENVTPPKDKEKDKEKQPGSVGRKARFDVQNTRPHKISHTSSSSASASASAAPSRAPSSYRSSKRARLSPFHPEDDIDDPSHIALPAERTKSSNRRASSSRLHGSSTPSTPTSVRPPSSRRQHHNHRPRSPSLSGASIPISALISPHAPSIQPSNTFHMYDPHKPSPISSTSWALSLPVSAQGSWIQRGGSSPQAFIYFLGFVLFPIWFIGGWVVKVPRTRRIGGGQVPHPDSKDLEQGSVLLDDPQLEHDAQTWRRRCQIMAIISIFTYIPFIILVAVFASRSTSS